MGIFGGLAFAGIFYAAAEYEHMSGWKWALASVAVSLTIRGLFPLSFIFVLPGQFGLFCILAWMNIRAKKERETERAKAAEEDRRRRQDRARLSREQASTTDSDAREAARAAREEAELRERQERVRRAREAREREEREQAERNKQGQ
jgi:flagellar biosynthesis GTPase FlhF